MDELFTRDGRPLRMRGPDLIDRAGRHVARRVGAAVFAPDGRYAGTVVGNRVVYRAEDDVVVATPFAPHSAAGSSRADEFPLRLRGREPFADRSRFPDSNRGDQFPFVVGR